ncbi:SigE family RNA polymerase sigma factor [Streptomyces montanus]|uniref:SigE family RNA polymerase sigma factor n=1 Tax=Streptomyces montanus TaxID=2580423 RepID=A0A5R9FP41_9ACTN|nr:SigE family RNA polymerase sigma factor [Streptomyces montanus]TLS44389.1 SigE family RNA polymerase sigma factor [Streptomyces montanus]
MRDARVFDDFYAGTVRRLTSQMYAMTGSLVEAEDLVQEAFARAWQNWEKVSGYADPEAWVRSVACRIRVSVWRKAGNRLTAHRRHGMPDEVPGVSPDYVAIVAALRRIPYEQRRAIVLHHLVGLSVEETARETEVAPGTVKARLSRGRHMMARYLSDIASDRPGGAARSPGLRPAVSAPGIAPAVATDVLGSADQEVHHHD